MDKRKTAKFDWEKIQNYYNDGSSLEKTMIFFDIKSKQTFYKAINRGVFKSRNLSESSKLSYRRTGKRFHSEETKKKISNRRIAYLTANPDKVPYKINHSSKKSWPEQVFENALIASGISGWTYRYQNGIYEYDFAFLEKKIDVEIDGGTHKSEKVKKIDKRRDEFSKSRGWKVIRFEASRIKKDVVGCINELKNFLQSKP
jgi:very-short-patch-repair endonuclease